MDHPLAQSLQTAVSHHQAGRLAQAEAIYRQILHVDPNQPDALHLLGVIAHHAKQYAVAIQLIDRAVANKPDWPEAIYNLGLTLNEAGRVDDAIAAYQRALTLRPKFVQALNSLGIALQARAQTDAAITAYQAAIDADPHFADAYNNLGNALRSKGRVNEAIAAYKKAIELRPTYAEAHNNLGVVLQEEGELTDAIQSHRRALSIRIDYEKARQNLSQAFGRLGIRLASEGKLDDAVAAYESAITAQPTCAAFHNNLGTALFDLGRLDDTIAAFNRAVELDPMNASFASAAISALHYQAGLEPVAPPRSCDACVAVEQSSTKEATQASQLRNTRYDQAQTAPSGESIAEAHFRWNRQHAAALATQRPEINRNHRLRIGYVSPDFRFHPVGRFLLPLLENHDHKQFETFCYSDVRRADEMTARFQSLADHWRDITQLDHAAVAEQIRADAIDILVDLSGHTSGNRLLVFARKPAPVQVSWLGYPGTTGMTAIDHRFTDAFADPPGMTEHLHSEKLIRLPHTNWCFHEPPDSPPVAVLDRDVVRFCSFNLLAKLTPAMLDTWGVILQRVPHSELVIKAGALTAESARARIRSLFARRDVDPNRLVLLQPTPDHATHLAAFSQMDIALDTFPYHGTTTTCEALWMGLPVITLGGQTHVSRVGVSLLNNTGLGDLIAATPDDYVQTAVDLANNRDRLRNLRRTLRDNLRQSPLMDAKAFARNIEAEYLAERHASCG